MGDMRASSGKTVHEIQSGLSGMALIGSRVFNVGGSTAKAGFSQYLLLNQDQSDALLAGGLGRALRYDGYMSADEFLALDRQQTADIEQLGVQSLELPSGDGKGFSADTVEVHKEFFAALLADLWSAFYSRFERSGVCLFPVGVAVEGDLGTFWDMAGALVDFVAAYMPKAAKRLFSVTAGGMWQERGRQSGSAFYICCGGEKLSGSGCYDLTHFAAEYRDKEALLRLTRALLNHEDIRFYRRMEELSGGEYGRGPGRLCLDPKMAAELYRIQKLFDNGESVDALIQAWISFESALKKAADKKIDLTPAESARVLEPIVSELMARLKNADSAAVQKAYLPVARYVMQARAENANINKDLDDELQSFLIDKPASAAEAAQREARFSALGVLCAEIEKDKRLTDEQHGGKQIELVIGWLKRHRVTETLTEAEEEKIQSLAGGECAFSQKLRSELCGYAADVLEGLNGGSREANVGRLKSLLKLLNNSGVEVKGETRKALCAALRTRLKAWYSKETLPEDMLDRLKNLGGESEDCSGWGVVAAQLKSALDNNCEEPLNAGVGKALSSLPNDEAKSVKESFDRWMCAISERRPLTAAEMEALRALKGKRSELEIDTLIQKMVSARLAKSDKGQLAELKRLMQGVDSVKAYKANDVEAYLNRAYCGGKEDLSEEDKSALPAWGDAQAQIHAFLIKRLSQCGDLQAARQCIELLGAEGVRAGETDVLFGFLRRARGKNDNSDEQMLTAACDLLKTGEATAKEQWIEYLKEETGASAIRNCLCVQNKKGIDAEDLKELADVVIGCGDQIAEEKRDDWEEALCRFAETCPDTAEAAARCLARHEKKKHSDETCSRMQSIREFHGLGYRQEGDEENRTWYSCRVRWAIEEYRAAYKDEPSSVGAKALSVDRINKDLEKIDAQKEYEIEALARAFYGPNDDKEECTLESRLLEKAETPEDVERVKRCRENINNRAQFMHNRAQFKLNDDAEQKFIKFVDLYGRKADASKDELLACFEALCSLKKYRSAAARILKKWEKPGDESPWPRFLLYTLKDDDATEDWEKYFCKLYEAISDDGDWTVTIKALSGHDKQKILNIVSWLRWQIGENRKLRSRYPEARKRLQKSFKEYVQAIFEKNKLEISELEKMFSKSSAEEWVENFVEDVKK